MGKWLCLVSTTRLRLAPLDGLVPFAPAVPELSVDGWYSEDFFGDTWDESTSQLRFFVFWGRGPP